MAVMFTALASEAFFGLKHESERSGSGTINISVNVTFLHMSYA